MRSILLIDDDAQLGEPLAAYFARFGLRLEQALRPSDGLARLVEGGWDAALLDVMLPEQDGFALFPPLRQGSDLPTILPTARGDWTDGDAGWYPWVRERLFRFGLERR